MNNWIKRFEQQRVEGLRTKEGRGRNPILRHEDLPFIRAMVQQQQPLSQAQHIIEQRLE